jgi:hypothetical protein
MNERRLIEVQLQRYVPQTATVVVSVPHYWSDDFIKRRLSDIYTDTAVDDHNWCDQDDFDPREGIHELSGEPAPDSKVDLIYPEGEMDDNGANSEG